MIGGYEVWVAGDTIRLPVVPRLGDIVAWRKHGTMWVSGKVTRVELSEGQESVEIQVEDEA